MLNEIDTASEMLLMLRHQDIPPRDPQAKFVREQRAILARGFKTDTMALRVDSAVREIEAICRPIIHASVRF